MLFSTISAHLKEASELFQYFPVNTEAAEDANIRETCHLVKYAQS